MWKEQEMFGLTYKWQDNEEIWAEMNDKLSCLCSPALQTFAGDGESFSREGAQMVS